ncbi:hypothetical protein LEMLEM_LOCUS5174 [Lemmus lemmus]
MATVSAPARISGSEGRVQRRRKLPDKESATLICDPVTQAPEQCDWLVLCQLDISEK